MFVIEVIPLARGVGVETLTYYSATSYPLGSLLSIPLRKKNITGIVTATKPVSLAKTALKTATFSLRKLTPQKEVRTLPHSLIETAKKLVEMYPARIGAILYALLPAEIREGVVPYPRSTFHVGDSDAIPHILTDTTENRFISYRSAIRETFAHRGSTLFLVPTAIHAEFARKKLEKGIEQRIIVLSSALSKKQQRDAYEAFEDLSSAKLIIATPAYAFLDRHDITSIIVERSANSHYRSRTRPYLNTAEIIKVYGKITKRSILFGDLLPATADEYERRNDAYLTHNEHSKRLDFTGTLLISEHPKKESGEEFSLTTSQARDTMKRTLARGGHVFLYSARKGHSTLVTCFDCGHVFRCPDSGAPYTLQSLIKDEKEERWFVSATSGKRVRANDTCPICGGWRLREQGIGVQQMYKHIVETFPKIDIYLFDHTTATTHKKARAIIDSFYQSKRSILIGTNMALPFLSKGVDMSVVTSYEALRSVPTWRADETIFSTLLQLREITQKDVVVHLRSEEDEILKYATRGLVDQFYDSEINIRKALAYPPFSTFILLSYKGTKQQVTEIELYIKKQLEGVELNTYTAPTIENSTVVRHCLIRNKKGAEYQKELVQKLRELPPYIKIEVNPERIV